MIIVYLFLFPSLAQLDGASVKDFLRCAVNFFVAKQQFYIWEIEDEAETGKTEKKTGQGPARRPQAG
jgi:hypothetical protein